MTYGGDCHLLNQCLVFGLVIVMINADAMLHKSVDLLPSMLVTFPRRQKVRESAFVKPFAVNNDSSIWFDNHSTKIMFQTRIMRGIVSFDQI